jgi:hypothetical protein
MEIDKFLHVMKQHIFRLTFVIEGATEKLPQNIIPLKSIYDNSFCLMN